MFPKNIRILFTPMTHNGRVFMPSVKEWVRMIQMCCLQIVVWRFVLEFPKNRRILFTTVSQYGRIFMRNVRIREVRIFLQDVVKGHRSINAATNRAIPFWPAGKQRFVGSVWEKCHYSSRFSMALRSVFTWENSSLYLRINSK